MIDFLNSQIYPKTGRVGSYPEYAATLYSLRVAIDILAISELLD